MSNLFYSSTNAVKRAFSATESYLLQLREAAVAVLGVFRPSSQKELYLQPKKEEIDNTSDTQHEYVTVDVQSESTLTTNETSKPEKQSLISYINSTVCYLFFPCTCILFPKKCYSNATSPTSCNALGCNFCFCLPHGKSGSCVCNFMQSQYFCNAITVLCPFLVLGFLFWKYYTNYVSHILNSFEVMDDGLAIMILIALFAVASLPLVWGYVVLNLVAGYRFGIFQGVVVVMISVTIGLTLTHRISKRFCGGCIFRILKRQANSDHLEAILKMLHSPSGLKVIALTRLTPIPFGLQNGLFSLSDIPTRHYVAASNIGLFPTQVLNCYIGSTFHSAEDIFTRDGDSWFSYLVFIVQLSIGIALLTFVIRHARRELAKALQSSTENPESNEDEAVQSDASMLETRVMKQPSSITALQTV